MPDRRTSPQDRRRAAASGRRRSDPEPDVAGVRVRTSATLVWELPDETRCWIRRHRGQIVAQVSRRLADLRLELCESESAALSQAELWRVEFDTDVKAC